MRWKTLGVFMLTAVLLTGCREEIPSYTESRDLLGTTVSITIYGADTVVVRAVEDAFAAMEKVNSSMNRFNPDSELSRLNARAGTGAVQVSGDLYELIKTCDWYSGKTYGTFDATVLPIMTIWDMKADEPAVPPARKIASALALVGYNKLELNSRTRTVVLPETGMGIDLGGIAKGYAVDRAVQTLRQKGVSSGIIIGAGNIAVIGFPPERNHWRIAVKHPRDPGNVIGTLKITSGAVATSGDYERFFEVDGKRYSHIMDPLTGWPVSNGVISVTVVAPTAQEADALSTAIFVMGAEKGLKFTEFQPAIESIIVTEDDSGRLDILFSAGLRDIYEPKTED